jgi:hypothetical protein
MNRLCALLLSIGALCATASAQAVVIRGGGQIQVQGNGVVIFNSPTIVNELPDISVPLGNASDSVLFTNGDFLYGKLISIGPQHQIRWQHPDATEPIEFRSTNITQIDLSSTRRSLEETNNCKVDFVNSDSIKGNLVSCDKDSVVLDTAYAGQLRLSRSMLESLVMIPRSQPAIFEGPTGLDGWTPGKSIAIPVGEAGQFSYRNGAFYATKAASIARDVHLPDTAQIEFDLVWKSTLHMAIALYSDSLQPVSLASKESAPDFGGFYSFQVNSSYMDMMPIKKRDPLKSLGAIAVPALMQRDRAHFDIRASKRDRKLALLINGVLVKEWIDPDGFAGEGTAMRFVHQGQGSVKMSNIRIRPWDGQLEQPTPAPSHRPSDSVRLADGTRFTGEIESINNGKLTIATGNSTPQISLAQLRQIDFASQSLSATQTNSQPVKVLLTPGYTISGQLDNWNADGMTLTSPSFGKARIDSKAVSRLQFTHD